MVVQHNMQALNANRMLNVTTGAQSKSTEKLSSGYKINRAADDAAGLSISEKMRKQINGLDRASTNAEDGVSAVQTAEGALTEVHSMLQRMNELAVQAANGTNSLSDRQAIQDEIVQLTTEVDRVAETTKFNETYLLKGSYGTKQVYMSGKDAGITGTFVEGATTATLTVDLSTGTAISIGGVDYNITAEDTLVGFPTDRNEVSQEDRVALNGSAKDGLQTMQSIVNALGENDTINIGGTIYTVTIDASTGETVASAAGNTYTIGDLANKVKDGTEVSIKINSGTKNGLGKLNNADYDTAAEVNAAFKKTVICRDYTNKNNIGADKARVLIQQALVQANNVGTTPTNGGKNSNVDYADKIQLTVNGENEDRYRFNIEKGTATAANTLSFSLHVGADADMTNKITVGIETMSTAGLGINGLNVADDSGIAATYAIDAIAEAVQKVSDQRSALGAVQNRLEHTMNNLDNVVENTTASESRIRDTDMAEEMVEYSKSNILAQAGQSMLAQANQSTQGVLSLLG